MRLVFRGTSLKFIIRNAGKELSKMTERLISILIGYVFGLFQTSYIIGKMI